MKITTVLAAAAALLTMGAAQPGTAPPTSEPMASVARASGYLGAGLPDTYAILPPAPAPGDPRDVADREVFRATRTLQGTARWTQAQNDADQAGIVKDLACAVGVELTPQNAPRTFALLRKLAPDVGRATNLPKDIYKRPRPYLRDEGPICVGRTAALAASPDYPSGHNTWAWTVGLIMAELVPDRATPILVRARAFGENRLVCGVHSLSAVEMGQLNGSIVVAALHGNPQFRSDLDAARAELAAVRRTGPRPDPAVCAREAALDAHSPF
ncbi:MAG: phosphatase PAP2 family protein [Alphaproteobacteria bacterium]|nr:phosphatase PAP2 family protein [Alphaproteobacteria bacterium]